MLLTDLVHINEEGWAILSEVLDMSLPDSESVSYLPVVGYRFLSLQSYDGHPRVFTMPAGALNDNAHKGHCDARFYEDDDSYDCIVGDTVFYLAPRSSVVQYGKVTQINKRSKIIVVNGLMLNDHNVITFSHNFEQLTPSAKLCKTCKAIATLPYKAQA